jgi:hypothetical protein
MDTFVNARVIGGWILEALENLGAWTDWNYHVLSTPTHLQLTLGWLGRLDARMAHKTQGVEEVCGLLLVVWRKHAKRSPVTSLLPTNYIYRHFYPEHPRI